MHQNPKRSKHITLTCCRNSSSIHNNIGKKQKRNQKF